jgi:hypothetical protein
VGTSAERRKCAKHCKRCARRSMTAGVLKILEGVRLPRQLHLLSILTRSQLREESLLSAGC